MDTQRIKLGLECEGLLFGGYVRDFLIRQRPFKDLDIWFKTEAAATRFLQKVQQRSLALAQPGQAYWGLTPKDKLHPGQTFTACSELAQQYPFRVMQVTVFRDEVLPAKAKPRWIMVDLVVSPTFPVNDFQVNLLCWDGTKFLYGPDRTDETAVASIRKDILSGIVKMLPEYKLSLTPPKVGGRKMCRLGSFFGRHPDLHCDNFVHGKYIG